MANDLIFDGTDSIKNHRTWIFKFGLFFLATTITLFMIPLNVVYLIYKIAVFKTTKYKITDAYISIESGVFSKTINTLELWKINDLQLRQGIIQRAFGECSIVMVTQDRSDSFLKLECFKMKDGRVIFEKLQPAIAKNRTGNKVVSLTV